MDDPFKFLKANHRLPSPPGIAVRILHLVESEDSSLDDISKVISSDPVLTAKILKYVHSPLVGLGFSGTTVPEAVARIGMRGAQMLALSFSLISAKTRKGCPSFNLEQFWSESVARAVAARRLSKHLASGDAEDAFITALLCRLGKLVYATGLPQKYESILCGKQDDDRSLEEREREVLGMSHLELSVLLLRDWQLPGTVWETVERFASGEFDEAQSLLGRCLLVADAIAVLFAQPHNQDAPALAHVLDLGARHLELEQSDVEELLNQIGTDWTDYGRILSVTTGPPPDLESLRQEAEEHLEALRFATQVEVTYLRSENEQLNEIAQRDRLTGLLNRGAFDDALCEAVKAAQQSGMPVTLFMVDIDHFKMFNDEHGHPTGDRVLQHVARRINESIRRDGTVYRYGGEEFAILAPACAIEKAKAIAESLRQAIADSPFRDNQTGFNLTISIGVAAAHGPHEPHNADSLLACADRRLYDAKSSGRNAWRAESSEPMPAKGGSGRGMFSRLGKVFAPAGK